METGIEIYRQKVIIDIAFADDFGFDLQKGKIYVGDFKQRNDIK